MPRHRRSPGADAAGLVAAASVAAALACPAPAAGQALRGDVRAAESKAPLPYSTVVLDPGFSGRFTDDSGYFEFAALASGTYRLVVRAIGYIPFDTAIAVSGGGGKPIVLQIGLLPLAFELPPVTILGMGSCLRPGPPAPDSEPELAAIFDELRETAARYRLLSDAYPFRYWIERRVWDDPPPPHGEPLAIDTMEFRSNVRRSYTPGGLVEVQQGPRGRLERMLRVPTLVDLADSIFHKAHCFMFAGIDTIDGRSQLRVDFLAAERLRAPDVAGSAWLDAETYLLRRLTFRLTRPARALASVKSLEVTVAFGDLLPSVTVPTRIAATSEGARGPRRGLTGYEEQRLLRVAFLRAPPGVP